jgi:signal peptidase II
LQIRHPRFESGRGLSIGLRANLASPTREPTRKPDARARRASKGLWGPTLGTGFASPTRKQGHRLNGTDRMNPEVARSYRWLFWTMALLGLTLDQVGKYGVFASLYNYGAGGSQVVVDGFLTFEVEFLPPHLSDPGDGLLYHLRTVSGERMPAVNHGALWGQQLGLAPHISNLLFAGVSLVAALAMIIWISRPRSPRDGWLCFALGLIFAGAVGNGYDRLVFRGVRDFLRLHPFDSLSTMWTGHPFPIFNIADCCLVCGAVILVFQALFLSPKEEPKPAANQAAETSHPEPVSTE